MTTMAVDGTNSVLISGDMQGRHVWVASECVCRFSNKVYL